MAGVSAVDRSARALAVGEAAVAAAAAAGSDGGGSSSSSAAAAGSNIRFHEGDARALPLAAGCVDVAVAGWAISYLKSEHEEWYADGSSGGPWELSVFILLGGFALTGLVWLM